ncbi:MAG: DUF4214 domain-containing protein [Pseudomonadota bacterium]
MAKWGDPEQGTSGGVVTWSLAGGGLDLSTNNFPGATVSTDPFELYGIDVAPFIAEAFDEWSSVADIDFVQVPDGGGASGVGAEGQIRIFFGFFAGGAIGYAQIPFGDAPASGDILIRAVSNFFDPETGEPLDIFEFIVKHEIGHAINIPHIIAEEAVMSASGAIGPLRQPDIDAVQAIYGPANPDPAQYVFDPDRTDFVMLDAPEGIEVLGNALDNTIEGSDAGERLMGAEGVDRLFGNGGDDRLEGGPGDDRLYPGPGEDSVSGGEGYDTASIAGAYDPARVSIGPDSTTVTGPDGSATVSGVERLGFDNGVLALEGETGALGTVTALYLSILGRAPDGGVLFWQEALVDGAPLDIVAGAFVDSLEFAESGGAGLDDAAFVDLLYLNLQGNTDDAEGIAFWRGALEDGLDRGRMAALFAETAEATAEAEALIAEGLFIEGVAEFG